MKKLILIILFLISITSLAESQTRLKFGNVILKDTLTGSMAINSGNFIVRSITGTTSLILNPADGNNASISFLIGETDDITLLRGDTVIYRYTGTGGFSTFYQKLYASDDFYVAGNTELVGNATVGDNLTIDSILTLRQSATITLIADDSVVVITSSCMILTSDDTESTNRTFTISDGTTAGQLLIIEWNGELGAKEGEILDAGSESGLNGTMTFDALDDTIMLKWTGTYWRELSRTEH